MRPPLLFRPRSRTGGHPAQASPPAADGQAERFRQLILPHLDGAYNLARYLTRDPILSEDIVQDALVRACRGFGGFRGGSPRAWLYAIVRNCCRTAQSGAGGVVSLTVHESGLSEAAAVQLRDKPDPGLAPDEAIIREAEIARVQSAIAAIPEPFREAVVLRDMEDLSYAEIAEVTGVPMGTVMSRLSRGRSLLARELLPPPVSSDEQSRSAQ